MNSVANTMRQFNSAGKSTTNALSKLGSQSASAAQTVATSTQRMSTSMATAATSVANNSQRMTTSLALLSRIAFTQAVVRGLSQMRRAFEETASQAIKLQDALAEIKTIDYSGKSLSQLSADVQGISDSFNIPILQAAEGLYQTLSNQVGTTAESLQFLGEAAKFAKATSSSLDSSVDLLSGAMKSFGLSVEDTDKIASSFFKTIELGRVRAEELSNRFGQLGPIAAEAGLSLDEVNAAIAAISVKGTNAAHSMVELRSIISAFLKPSDALKDTLQELGFSSGDVAFKTLGLSEALRQVAESTGGSTAKLAALFPNVRALAGEASLTSDGLKEMASDLDAISEAGRNLSNQKFLEATQTDAYKTTKALNQLKNAFTTGLGNSLLKTSANFIDAAGGADKLAGALQSSGDAMIGAGGTLTLLLGKLTAAKVGAVGLSQALGALALVPLAKWLGSSLGEIASNKRDEAALAGINKVEAQNAAAIKTLTDLQSKQRDADNATTHAQIQNALKLTAVRNKEYLKQADAAKAAQKTIDQLEGKRKLNAEQTSKLNKARATVRQFQGADFLQGLPADKVGKLLGRKITTPDELSRGLLDLEKRTQQIRPQIDASFAQIPQANGTKKAIDKTLSELAGGSNARGLVGGFVGETLAKQFNVVDAAIKALAKDTNITNEEMAQFVEQAQALNTLFINSGRADQLSYNNTLLQVGKAASQLKSLKDLQNAPSIVPQQAELGQIDAVLGQFNQAEASTAAIAKNWTTAANAAERAAAAAVTIQNPFVHPAAESFGGMPGAQHYAGGGLVARGTDTIPAMLSPGEFVVNAASSRKFFSQLTAINAGVTPSSPTVKAGDVHYHVGDVHVHGNAEPVTPRDMARAVQRELRRSTIPNRF
jgi:TP901 family phage tail tape measure protein